MKRMTRREVLKYGALAGGSLLLPIGLERRGYAGDSPVAVKPFTLPFSKAPVLQPVRSDANTDYYEITIRNASGQVIPGKTTQFYSYTGRGLPSKIVGPTIKQRVGRQSVVRFINNTAATPNSVHLHGMASLPQYDGYAEDLTRPGYYKDYIYPNNRAATLWYHDHAIHHTAENVYRGMAGLYIVQDDYELNLPLPKGEYDVPIVIQDKQFAANGALIFDDDGQDSQFGDIIAVNGVAWPVMKVEQRKYRFRACNGSVSRSYRLALSNGADFIMIGTDAGLMSAPVSVKNFRFGMAERYEFVLDFSQYPVGTQIILRNLSNKNNEDYANTDKVMRFDVVASTGPDTSSIPATLRTVTPIPASSAVRTREFRYERSGGLWVINGKTWDSNRVDGNPQLGDTEIWRLYNNSGGWFHPIHLHLIDCQILSRNGQPPFPYERGWKDVFYVGENEDVRVIGKYGPNTGKYMQHCHNTVHEDHDMMTQFEVAQGGPDPVTAAPPKPLPASPL